MPKLTNFLSLIFDKLIRLLLSVFITSFVARHLGPTDYGKLTLALSLALASQALAKLGMDGFIVNELARGDTFTVGDFKKFRAIVSNALLASILIACSILFFKSPNQEYLLVVVFSIPLCCQFSEIYELNAQAEHKYLRVALIRLLAIAVSATLKVATIVLGLPLLILAAAYVAEYMTYYALLIVKNRHRIPVLTHKLENSVRRQFHICRPFAISALLTILYMRSSVFVLAAYKGPQEVASLTSAQTIIEALYIFPVAYAQSYGPILSRKFMASAGSAKMAYSKFSLYSLLGGLALSFSLFMFAPTLINLIFGREFQSSIEILRILSTIMIPVSLGLFQQIWYLNHGKNRMFFIQSFSAAATCLALNFLLIPSLGAVGAAIAIIASQWVQALLVPIVFDVAAIRNQFHIKSLWR